MDRIIHPHADGDAGHHDGQGIQGDPREVEKHHVDHDAGQQRDHRVQPVQQGTEADCGDDDDEQRGDHHGAHRIPLQDIGEGQVAE